MKKIIFLCVLLILLSSCNLAGNQTTFEWSDGTCVNVKDCVAVESGCGGGHTVCTNDIKKWENIGSGCDMIEDHPLLRGYKCSCVLSEKKCGWVK